MGSEIHMSFLGGLLAFVFAASMGILLWWMFHVPRAIPMAAAKARRAVGAIKKILVPTSGTIYSERGIELACRLGEEQNAELAALGPGARVERLEIEIAHRADGHERIGALAADLKWPFIGAMFGGTQRLVPRVQLVLTPPTPNPVAVLAAMLQASRSRIDLRA